VVLPGAAWTEQQGLFVNTEGRAQMAFRAGFPPGEAREDWAILRALSERVGAKLPYDSLAQLRAALFEAHPHLARIDQIAAVEAAAPGAPAALSDRAYVSAVRDYYLTNPIARASAVMAEMSRLAAVRAGADAMAAE